MTVKILDKVLEIQSPEPLIFIFRKMNIHFPVYCGNGRCGKCLIRVKDGILPVTEADRQYLSGEQLEAGYRLACQAIVSESCTIELTDIVKEQEFYIPSPSVGGDGQADQRDVFADNPAVRWGIAIDIGTTTIAMVLVNLNTGNSLRQYTGLNHQRSYGTDVMARIRAASENKDNAENLRQLIQNDIFEGLLNLTEDMDDFAGPHSFDDKSIHIAIAGNTTMIHLLRGYDCRGLGQYPFKPHTLEEEHLSVQELLGAESASEADMEDRVLPAVIRNARVTIFPGISAFVGGDITAGLLACDLMEVKRPHLFLDLGTNAEMAVGCGGDILATSAAAGPAFEGGHLSCGIGSVPGAVKEVKLQYGLVRYETIGRKQPIGICGTGIVACMSEMLKNRCMDSEGLLKPKYAAGGFQIVPGKIVVTQGDIREFQKAKAAIRAGLDLLMSECGYSENDIEAIDLAGGFGCQLDVDRAVHIGLIPQSLASRVKQRGNTVIQGLVRYMTLAEGSGKIKSEDSYLPAKLASRVKVMSLGIQEGFTENYIRFMNF